MHDNVQGKRAEDGDVPAKPANQAFPDMQSVGVALEAGQVGVWSWDIKSNDVTWSGDLPQIHGFSEGAFDGKFTSIQRSIHPEDQPEVSASIQESLRTGKPYRAQYRLAPSQDDQEDRWVEAIASVVQENGMAVRMLGICRDVTDRQKLLRELRAARPSSRKPSRASANWR